MILFHRTLVEVPNRVNDELFRGLTLDGWKEHRCEWMERTCCLNTSISGVEDRPFLLQAAR